MKEKKSDENHDHSHHHDVYVQGEKLEVDQERFKTFLNGLSDSQVAVINVNGMVCDFCAQGLEKTFKKDRNVKKIDVVLSKGKFLNAFS